jgi:hypothetical protein
MNDKKPLVWVIGYDKRTREVIADRLNGHGCLGFPVQSDEDLDTLPPADIAVINFWLQGKLSGEDLIHAVHERHQKIGIIATWKDKEPPPAGLPVGARRIHDPHKGDGLSDCIGELLSR